MDDGYFNTSPPFTMIDGSQFAVQSSFYLFLGLKSGRGLIPYPNRKIIIGLSDYLLKPIVLEQRKFLLEQ